MSRPDLSAAMDELAAKAREMLADPELKASGLAAATQALKAYAAYREEADRRPHSVDDEPIRLPRPGVLDGYRANVGNPLGHDGSA